MRNFFLSVMVFLLLVIFSCCEDNISASGDKTTEETVALEIYTDIVPSLRSTRSGMISAFKKDDKLGLFITDGDIDNEYAGMGVSKNLLCYNLDGSSWKFWAQYFLNADPATVFAYHPYKEGTENPRRIPIEHNSQTDYMYGTHTSGQTAINRVNPQVNLTMKHALALVQFNIRSQAYPGECILSKIEIANAEDKSVFYSEGTMDISTGEITYISGKNAPVVIQNESTGILQVIPGAPHFDQKVYPKAMVMPLKSFSNYGDLQIRFTINEKVYTRNITNGTEWKAGTKNTYTVTVTGQDLIIDQVNIEDWLPGVDGMMSLY